MLSRAKLAMAESLSSCAGASGRMLSDVVTSSQPGAIPGGDSSCRIAPQSAQGLVDIRAAKFAALSGEEIDAWSDLQRWHPEFESPFFRPEFSALLAEYQPDVEVAVLRTGHRCVGFWPFQRGRGNVARTDGHRLRSYEGVVCDPSIAWSPEELLAGCRLSAWKFDHLLLSHARLEPFRWSLSTSPVIDLSPGSESYLQRKCREHSHTIELMLRNKRRAERELGPVRLVPVSGGDRVVDTIIEWKRAQFQRIHSIDHLAPAWRRAFVKRVATFRSEHFSGMTHALYAGSHLLAAHLGLRSGHVLHGWFPVYNRCFQTYSPGIMLWALLAELAPELGITRIDLGKGPEYYKDRLKTGDLTVAQGVVDRRFARRTLRMGWRRVRRAIMASPLGNPLRKTLYACRALRGYGIHDRNVRWSHIDDQQAGAVDDR
jgi:CelD/BcsL family acetyltransferase involved in cellulose biosynthesis